MYQESLNDTISAISTPQGQGGIGIVRLSGKEALKIADKIFVAKNNKKPSSFSTYSVHYGKVIDANDDAQVIDEALIIVMKAPKSYTAEDVVEISCHGGIASLKKILSLTLESGARLAQPGEFTKRAFLNGRMDLTQAEAVLDVIQAKTEAFLRTSVNQLKGDLTFELESIRELLMNVYIEIEAIVNFPEDDIDTLSRQGLMDRIDSVIKRVDVLLLSSEQGRIMKEGVKVVICGKPNVGKSSLLNVLLRTPRAIVSDVKGTTRDTIEEFAQIKGIPLQLVDTAGILHPRNSIEREAVRRSHLNIDQAELVLFMVDISERISKEDQQIIDKIKGKNVIVVLNKSDKKMRADVETIKKQLESSLQVKISAVNKQGIDVLEESLVRNILHGTEFQDSRIMISNVRQIESLKKCLFSIQNAKQHFFDQLSLEFVSEEIKLAIDFLDEITGKNISQDLLDKIFSSFCIGK
ncbi:MAG: tRNA uridine-5-carboxymethylaminomethyl(34) synthesis GTPase MnmE [Candidatus Omnitrophica bacterium]|nr:tRNA uridine-5-carboxymethylaminomethyl(34) synthesis GTPase MnmE [Candidatus Omnitrophota bacterium]